MRLHTWKLNRFKTSDLESVWMSRIKTTGGGCLESLAIQKLGRRATNTVNKPDKLKPRGFQKLKGKEIE